MAYEEEIIVEGEEETDENDPSGVFYLGMPEEKRYQLLNDIKQKIDIYEARTLKRDTRSVDDSFRNRNSINPGHQHLLVPFSPAQITANSNDYDIKGKDCLRLTTDASRNITGFNGGFNGKYLYIFNTGSFNIVLVHQSSLSVAANRIITFDGNSVTIEPDESIMLWYDKTTLRWRTVEQGEDNIETLGTFTAYEAITAGDAVALVAADALDQSYSETNQSGDQAIGDAAARTYVSQGFRAGATTYLNKVDLYLKKTGSPSGNLTVHIYSNSGTTPSISLGSATILGTDVTTSYQYLSAIFDAPISLVTTTAYHIVITRTEAVNATNYFICGSDTSSPTYHPVASAIYAVHEGDATPTWTLTGSDNVGDDDYIDLIFKTYKEDTASAAQVRLTNGLSELRTQNFIGFANSTVAAGASVVVTRLPTKSSLTSITPGRIHYISDTAGAISTTAGTNNLEVGIGNSTTWLAIINRKSALNIISVKNGITTRVGNAASGSQTIAHGLGTTPLFVRITARKLVVTNDLTYSDGVYNGTTMSCVYTTPNTSSDASADAISTAIIHIQDSSGNTQVATVTVDATNITLSWTLTGTPTVNDLRIMWEAFA